MSARFACMLALLTLLAALWWQQRTIADQTARLTEAEAANAVLREHAAALLNDIEDINTALLIRETAHEAIDAGRDEERRKAAELLRDHDAHHWGAVALPGGMLGLLYDGGATAAGDREADAPGPADAGDARAQTR